MPFNDAVGNGAMPAPAQMAGMGVKVGVIVGLTVIVNVVVDAH